ncbi:YrrS family protein [Halobacillus locisalis]|uniref:YrrS family protein n=1 Tax=Halobacillus locisalis TaxID=220753 RepID=A0A838CNA0_9BACI|nr:YrrS family protein [Halobacillus locisalis]MBA2173510.1 YrrS family protein [Halobacillus locisalis]
MTNSFHSRSNRYEKKRKGTKMMTWLMGAAGLLVITFVALFIFGGNETDGTAKQPEPSESVSVEDEEEKENTNGDNDDSQVDENAPEKSSDQQDSEVSSEEGEEPKEELTVIENSDDENVKRIIKKNWKPLQTEQTIEGEHRITYDTESQDWVEMEQVVRDVTGLTKDNMITQYIGNGGTPNKAIATVYNKNNKDEVYRVYLEWIEGTGFQAQQMDELNQVPQ